MQSNYFTTFEHKADIGIRGIGQSLEQAFIQGARALFAVLVQDLQQVRPLVSRPIKAGSYDLEGLFVAWLNALIAEADVQSMLFCGFEVNIFESTLQGTAWGEKFDQRRHQFGVEVKGATFTELFVGQRDKHWIAQCVVDV